MKSSKPLWETVTDNPTSRALIVLLVFLLATLILGAYGFSLLYSDIRVERDQYKKRIADLSAEVEQYKSALRNVSPQLSPAQQRDLPKPADAALLQSKLQVHAACEDLKKKGPNQLVLYYFTFWLTGPDEVLSRINSVDYFLDHPSFTQKDLISKDRLSGFRQGYNGWGCLDSVLVKISFSDSSLHPTPIDFNQCKALENQSCSEH